MTFQDLTPSPVAADHKFDKSLMLEDDQDSIYITVKNYKSGISK